MREPASFHLGDFLILILVLAAAAGVRSWYLLDAADSGQTNGPVRVQDDQLEELKDEVAGLREHQGFAALAPLGDHKEQTAFRAPGYAYAFYLVDMLFVEQERERMIRWGQMALGALTAGLFFLFSLRAFQNRVVAGLAGFLCALNPFAIAGTAQIADGVLASFLLALSLVLGSRASGAGGAFTSLLFGLSLAALALVRAALLPFGFVAVLWFLFRCRGLPRGWLYALLAFLGFANGLVPWSIRNYQTFGEVLPVVDSTYYHLWMGNNSSSLCTGGPQDEKALVEALARPKGEDPAVTAGDLAALPEDLRYRQLSGPFWDEVRTHPGETLRRRLWSGLCFFFGEEWLLRTSQAKDQFSGSEWLGDALPIVFSAVLLAMLLLGGLGWRWSFAWSKESMPAGFAVVWVFLPSLLSHGEALYGPRLPLDGVLLCYVAFALVGLVPGHGYNLRHPADAGEAADDRTPR